MYIQTIKVILDKQNDEEQKKKNGKINWGFAWTQTLNCGGQLLWQSPVKIEKEVEGEFTLMWSMAI